MTVKSLMQTCAELGIKLALRDDDDSRLRVDAPKGALTSSLRDALAAHKSELIAALKSQQTSQPTQPQPSAPEPAEPVTRTPASTTPQSPEATPLILEHPSINPAAQSHRTEAEVSKLLSGSDYDESVVNSSDAVTRQIVSAQLLAALGSRHADERARAKDAFVSYGYFTEATSQVRTADSPA